MTKVSVNWRSSNIAECTVDGTITEERLVLTAKNKSLAIYKNPEVHPRKYLSAPWEQIIKDLFKIQIVRRVGGIEVHGDTVVVHFIGKSLTDFNRKYYEDLLIKNLGGAPNALPTALDETMARAGRTIALVPPLFRERLQRIAPGHSNSNLALLNELDVKKDRAKNPRRDSSGRKSSLLR